MSWPVPKFAYAQRVKLTPMDDIKARVVDLHFFGSLSTVEYDVVYYEGGKQNKIRVFEDDIVEDNT